MEISEILEQLDYAREKDLKYSDGKILSSMCTSPHPFAKKVYNLFMETNLGDVGLFKGTKELEEKAIKILGSMLGNANAKGFIVSGGTEANVMALWAARNALEKENPEVVAPEHSHFSIEKAADLLRLKLVKAEVRKCCVSVKDVERKVSKNTVAIVGIAGSTEYGTIDDIEVLSEIALKEKIFLHVDAAFGGFVIPFMKELGYDVKEFDFSIEGVTSITLDPHKMGLCPIPSGGIIFRDEEFLKKIATPSPYLSEKVQYTISGTRSGASAACTYALLKLLGMRGYKNIVKKCIEATQMLYEKLRALGIDAMKPTLNILVFKHKEQDRISKCLSSKGWSISRTRKGEIRIVIMPHAIQKLNDFVKDLKACL